MWPKSSSVMSVCYFFALIFIRLLTNISARERFCERDNSLEDITFNDSYVLYEVSNIFRKLQCVGLCQDNYKCISFGYNSLTMMCRFYSTGFRSTIDGIVEKSWTNYKCGHRDCSEKEGFVYNYEFGICFYLSPYFSTYNDAKENCNVKGSQVISLDTKAKIDMLEKVLNATVVGDVYIGLKNIGIGWIWENGNVLGSDKNWHSSQPYCPLSSVYCGCVVARQKWAWKWNDIKCDELRQIVCLKDLA